MDSIKAKILVYSLKKRDKDLANYMRPLFSLGEKLSLLEQDIYSFMDLILVYNAAKES